MWLLPRSLRKSFVFHINYDKDDDKNDDNGKDVVLDRFMSSLRSADNDDDKGNKCWF